MGPDPMMMGMDHGSYDDGTRSNDDGHGTYDGTRSNDDGMGPMMGPDPMMMGMDPMMGWDQIQ